MSESNLTSEQIEAVARVCHEANRAYCHSMSDFSQVPWDEAPDWQRASAIEGVRYAVAHPEATPEDSHRSWLKLKEADGWTYGTHKNVELKQHPCMVAYEQLPAEQRRKDALFQAVVWALVE